VLRGVGRGDGFNRNKSFNFNRKYISVMLKCDRSGRSPSDVYEVIEYMHSEFGDVAVDEVHKGENVGWFLDQRLVSLMVSDWTRQHPGRVQLVYRDTIIDRSVAHKIGGVLAEALCLKRSTSLTLGLGLVDVSSVVVLVCSVSRPSMIF